MPKTAFFLVRLAAVKPEPQEHGLPKSVRNIPDGVEYLRLVLNPKKETQQSRLNSLESLFAGIETEQTKQPPTVARV